jgi:hypothetical protein
MSFLPTVFNATNLELPRFKALDEGIEYVMSYIGELSDGLEDKILYLDKRWVEVRDDVNFQENVLHVFKDGGTYLRILEGDISAGNWELNIDGFVIKFAGKHELYELVFLNEDFFILKKHGDQASKGQRTHFFLAREKVADGKEWMDLLEVMFTMYKENSNYIAVVIFIILIAAIILFFSLF